MGKIIAIALLCLTFGANAQVRSEKPVICFPIKVLLSDLKLKYKEEIHNTIIREINPTFSTQRCHICGHTRKSNQISQSKFHYKVCSHSDNVDRNASLNILNYDLWSLEQKTLVSLWKSKSLLVSCVEQEH